MSVPGFHATAVLTAQQSQFPSGQPAGRPLANRVQPAAAIYMDGRFVCYGEVTANGYIQCYTQGGGGERCRPGCGPCQSDPDSPTGRSRFCVRADCSDYTRRC